MVKLVKPLNEAVMVFYFHESLCVCVSFSLRKKGDIMPPKTRVLTLDLVQEHANRSRGANHWNQVPLAHLILETKRT